MAVTRVTLHYEGRGGSDNARLEASETLTYLIETDDQTDTWFGGGGGIAIRDAAGVPQLYDPHPANPLMNLRERRIGQAPGAPKGWVLECVYSNNTENESQQDDNPTTQPPRVSWGVSLQEEEITQDRDGKAILNTVGDPLIGIRALRPVARLTFSRKDPSFDHSEVATYVGKVNNGTFMGQTSGTVLCEGIEATGPHYTNSDESYWEVTYHFLIDPDGWQLSVLNEGLHALSGGERVRIKEGTDQLPISTPVPLSQAGAVIDPADLPGSAYFVTVNIYPEADLSPLGLPHRN